MMCVLEGGWASGKERETEMNDIGVRDKISALSNGLLQDSC